MKNNTSSEVSLNIIPDEENRKLKHNCHYCGKPGAKTQIVGTTSFMCSDGEGCQQEYTPLIPQISLAFFVADMPIMFLWIACMWFINFLLGSLLDTQILLFIQVGFSLSIVLFGLSMWLFGIPVIITPVVVFLYFAL